jgi:hypothetical protein
MKSTSDFKTDYQNIIERIRPTIDKWVKRIYVLAFNVYAWFWLYRQIFVRHSVEFEEYLLWFFTTVGMYYFVLDTKDKFFFENSAFKKKTHRNQQLK